MEFKYVRRGQRIEIPTAEFHNAVVDTVRAYFQTRKGYTDRQADLGREAISPRKVMNVVAMDDIQPYSIFTIDDSSVTNFDPKFPIVFSNQINANNRDKVYLVNDHISMGMGSEFMLPILGDETPHIVTYDPLEGIPSIFDTLGPINDTYLVGKSQTGLIAVSEADTDNNQVWVVKPGGATGAEFAEAISKTDFCGEQDNEGIEVKDAISIPSCGVLDLSDAVILNTTRHQGYVGAKLRLIKVCSIEGSGSGSQTTWDIYDVQKRPLCIVHDVYDTDACLLKVQIKTAAEWCIANEPDQSCIIFTWIHDCTTELVCNTDYTFVADTCCAEPQGGSGIPEIVYYIRDNFTIDDASPLDSTYACENDGSLTFTQTDGDYSKADGKLVIPVQASPSWGDNGFIAVTAASRSAGRMGYAKLKITGGSTYERIQFGFRANTTLPNTDTDTNWDSSGFYFECANGDLFAIPYGGSTPTVAIANVVENVEYELLQVLRTTGSFLFIRGGNYPVFTCVYVSFIGNSGSAYITLNNYDAEGELDNLKIPNTLLWDDIEAIVSDSFNRTDSSNLGSTDGAGITEGGGAGFAWTEELGSWDIYNNSLRNTDADASDLGALALINCGESDFVAGVLINSATNPGAGLVFRYINENNYWMAVVETDTVHLYEVTGGAKQDRAFASITPTGANRLIVFCLGTRIQIVFIATLTSIVEAYDSINHRSATKVGAKGINTYDHQYDDFWVLPITDSPPSF